MIAWMALGGGLVFATAVVGAAALAPRSWPSFLLAAYVLACADVVLLAELLSPPRWVGVAGYLLGELALFLAAGAAWLARGRPRPPALPRLSSRALRRHPLVALLGLAVVLALGWETFLVLGTPPNNWDSMTYHLPRAVSWLHAHRVSYVPAQTQRQNAFPPVAELEILYTLALLGRDTLVAGPQLLAELATLVGVYGIARRLGFARAGAAFAALLTATLTQVALQAVTTQNDLVVASFVVAAAYFALGSSRVETVLAGAALGLALGAKQTAALALPALLALAVARRRRRAVELAAAAAAGFVLLGAYGYVLNLAHTGRVTGKGWNEQRYQPRVTASGTVSTVARVGWRFVDLSGLHPHTSWTEDIGSVGSHLFSALRIPVNPTGATFQDPAREFTFTPNASASEGTSFFGPLGALLVLPLSLGFLLARALRRTRPGSGALALALPASVLALALASRYNVWLGRFLIAPVALTMPLAASVASRRLLAWPAALLGIATLACALAFDESKPTGFDGTTPIWRLGHLDAQTIFAADLRAPLRAVDGLVPPDGSVGAWLGDNEWVYPLFGPRQRRRVVYLSGRDPLREAREAGLRVVVLGAERPRVGAAAGWLLTRFPASGWTLAQRLG